MLANVTEFKASQRLENIVDNLALNNVNFLPDKHKPAPGTTGNLLANVPEQLEPAAVVIANVTQMVAQWGSACRSEIR